VERINRIIKNHLKKLSIELHLPWTQLLPLALACIRATPRSPSFLSPFEIMYGCPFLLGNLPPTDPAPLANNLPYLNLLRELLKEHSDQILPHPSEGPITISVKPGDLVLLKYLQPSPLGPRWTGPHLVILTTPTTVKLNGIPQWQHLSRIKHCPPTSDSSATVKDEYSCIPLGPTWLCLSRKLSPSSTPT
jgi:hypothetical protein